MMAVNTIQYNDKEPTEPRGRGHFSKSEWDV